MKDREKYFKLFGRLNSLAEPIPWSTAVSHLLEWLAWNPKHILGVSKLEYARRIIDWIEGDAGRNATRHEKIEYVKQKLKELPYSEPCERYAPYKYMIASSREALRRTKFFSEPYLNEEFDIFWTLVNDKYLDAFYRQFTHISGGSKWSTHGDSGLFQASTGIRNMEIDNLSYNETEALLVANELKLGGQKNSDQILKYAWVFKELREKKFIVPESRLLLLFIVVTEDDSQWEAQIKRELAFCENSFKRTARAVCEPDVVAIAKSAEIKITTWSELIEFNKTYATTLDPKAQQVEQKLLLGFNETLSAKAFMQGKIKP
jgi:hypothetical protein